MKKLFLFLFLGIFCFSEDFILEGYKNFKWGTDKKVVIKALGSDYKTIPESNKGISSIGYDQKIKIGNIEISGVKLIFRDEKLVEWDGWQDTNLEDFMEIVGAYAEKYGNDFYFSDYGKSGCAFTYFDDRGVVVISITPDEKGKIKVKTVQRIAFTAEEKANWLKSYNEHKELNESVNRTMKNGQDFIKNANPYTREPDRQVK